MANNPLLIEAMNKITIELINSLDYGDEIKLNKKYTLYHYCEDDIIVLNETKNWEEIFQVMLNDEEIIFEKI